jgi:hypothetical protein
MFRRYGFIAGGTVLALTLAACTNGTGSGSGGTAGSGGGVNGSVPIALSPVAQIRVALSKASNDKTVRVHGTITGDQATGTLDAQEQLGDNLEMSIALSLPGTQISEVWLGDTLYLKIPALASELGGKPWAKFSLSSLGPLGSSIQSLVNSAKNSDPAAQLQPLLASGDVKEVGTETVDGVQATHYTGTVDPATAFDTSQAVKNLTPAERQQLKSMLSAAGVTSETIDVWVASDGLPVEEMISTTAKAGAEKVDLHLSGWGQPVSISAPPADEVTDISSLAGGAGSALGG